MDCHPSCMSHLPWIWVIEALASSSQVNISLLLDLLENIPEKYDDLGRNAKELVSLRVLESIFVRGTNVNTDPSSSISNEKISFNPSDCCEDVLRQILTESSSHLMFGGVETSKWDLQPFLEHKRSNLGKYAIQEIFLKQLKNAILRENQLFPVFLKEQSGLRITNQPEHEAAANNGNCSSISIRSRIEGSDANDNHLMPNQNLVSAGRKRRAMCEAGKALFEIQVLSNIGHKPHLKSSGQHKAQDDKGDPQKTDENKEKFVSMCQRNIQNVGAVEEVVNISTDSDRNNDERDQNVSVNASKPCSLEKTTNAEGMGQNGPPDDSNNNCTSWEGVLGHDEILPPKKQARHHDALVLNGKFDQGQQEVPEVENAEVKRSSQGHMAAIRGMNKYYYQPMSMNVPNASEVEGFNISSYSEETSIATIKKAFLSSQCTSESGELNLCVKCKKGKELLVCSSDSCPIAIHESCCGLDASYDTTGGFYCPFCAYSRAMSKFTETKRKASLARKDLENFICLETQNEPKEMYHASRRNTGNHSKQDDGLPRSSCVERDVIESPTTHCSQRRKLKNEHVGSSKLSTDRIAHSLTEAKNAGKRRQVSESPQDHEERQMDTQAIHICQDENATCQDHTTDIISKQALTCYPETDLLHKNKGPSSSLPGDAEETSNTKSEDETSRRSKDFAKTRKLKNQISHPAMQWRRARIPWTSAEEDVLKEGVRLLSNPHEAMPWTKILEFGEGIFHENRTTIDLKDKWRNMCKAYQNTK